MSVKLATQVVSHSVRAAMKTAVETGQLPPSALETAYFIEQMNNTFDVINSTSKFNPNPYQCAISSPTNSHLKTPLAILNKSIVWVKTLKMVNEKRKPPCLESIEHSLFTTKLLWEDMEAEGAKYLLTGRLNQDPIENEFSVARQKCGFERNPSVRLFRQNLRHGIQAYLVQPPAGANCEPDQDELLTTVMADPESEGHSSPADQTTTTLVDDNAPNDDNDTAESHSDEENDDIIFESSPS